MTPQYIKIDSDGDKFYYKNKEMDIYHREDGPAIEFQDGYKSWYINGKRHREDGPAVEFANGDKDWYLDGKWVSKAEHARRTAKIVEITMDQIAEQFNIPVSSLKIVKN